MNHPLTAIRLEATSALTARPESDDEEAVRASLGKLLRAIGFSSRIFESASSFLASDAVGSDGCLLLDLRMPGMNGGI